MNTTIRNVSLGLLLLSPVAYAAVMLAAMLIGWGVAHASTVVMTGGQPAALADTAATWLLAGLVILKVLEMALARIAPLTKTKVDDDALSVIHGVRETAEEILAHVKPAPVTASGELSGETR